MQNLPEIEKPALKQQSTDIEVVFAEIGDRRLSFVVPLSDELDLIAKSFAEAKLHENQLNQLKGEVSEAFSRLFDREAARLGENGSWNQLSKLADLASLGGRFADYDRLVSASHSIANSPFTALRMAECAQQSKRMDAALHYLAQVEPVDPITSKVHRAYISTTYGNLDEALKIVNECKAIDPLAYEVNLFLGALELYRGNFRASIAAFRDALEERPNSSVAHTNIAIAWASEGKLEKAYRSATTAVALNPISKDAVVLLADLARDLKRDRNVLTHLEHITAFQPTAPTLWSRLARARFACGMLEEAKSALLKQAAFDSSPIVWNNLGVVESSRKAPEQAIRYYREALQSKGGDLPIDAVREAKFSATRNLIALLYEGHEWKRIRQIYEDLGGANALAVTKRAETLSDIHGYSLEALRKMGRLKDMVNDAVVLLQDDQLNANLRAWILANLLSICAMHKEHVDLLATAVEHSQSFLRDSKEVSDRGRRTLINNLAFALASTGAISEAESVLSQIQSALHHEAYPTATLGLIALRKGNAVRGTMLYRKAVSLAQSEWDKTRLRQKLKLELSRIEAKSDILAARRRLSKLSASKLDDSLVDEYRALSGQINGIFPTPIPQGILNNPE